MQGYVQDVVWAHQCYGNVGFVYKLMYKYKQYIVKHLNRLKQAHTKSLIQHFRVFYSNV